MVNEEIHTYPVAQEVTANGVTISVPWVQRQTNGAVIARVHINSVKHDAGELLLNESDVIALDPDERPLRTQVRRFWGYGALQDVTPAHLQTARFDVGFRADVAATRGHCGLSIAIIRAFRPGEGPRAIGGPWVFTFRIADDAEVASALRNEAAQREAAQREAAQREAARLERIRAAEAARQERFAARQAATEQPIAESREAASEAQTYTGRAEEEQRTPGFERGRRSGRFGRPDGRARFERPEEAVEPAAAPAAPVAAPRAELPAPDAVTELAREAILGPALAAEVAEDEVAAPPEAPAESAPAEAPAEFDRTPPPRGTL